MIDIESSRRRWRISIAGNNSSRLLQTISIGDSFLRLRKPNSSNRMEGSHLLLMTRIVGSNRGPTTSIGDSHRGPRISFEGRRRAHSLPRHTIIGTSLQSRQPTMILTQRME
jgi:hypothetical protein